MSLTPSRPVPKPDSAAQQRLEIELLRGEPVLASQQLQPERLQNTVLAPERWSELGACPVGEPEAGQVDVAVPHHWDQELRGQLARELNRKGFQPRFLLALSHDIQEALGRICRSEPASPPVLHSLTDELGLQTETVRLQEIKDVEDLEAALATANGDANSSPIINLVNRLLVEALHIEASDVHIEPQENSLEVRFRIDGVLQKRFADLPKKLIPAVTSRVKIMADLDIAERRMPQDGRIRRLYQGRRMDFRVSTLPSRSGEKVVLRLLDSGTTELGLNTLITDPETRQTLREIGSKPYGMVLVTGPTGSGKSTTLYALLGERNDPGINISTVEDPIEYTLPGITQTQVNREKGLDFATAMRAFMRQDPDVLLVGETRDLETAKTSMEAALTGHLVMTTLHCNDAASAIARLDEMGVEPFLVSASLLGVISQRLVRRVCNACRVAYHPSSEELGRFGLVSSHESEVTFYRANATEIGAKGCCPVCNGTGYKGRVGVFEILRTNDELSAAIAKRQSTDVLRRLALETGMKTLLGYGLQLVREGRTTLAEVERILLTDSSLESERRARSIHGLTCR
ncbi:MAG: GspE/PulE family protein, partial [Spirochaetia bacterium]